MDEKKRAPKLRFKGFIDDWEQRKIGEISFVNSGKDYKHLHKGNIPVYGTGGYMLSVDQSLSFQDAVGIGRKGTIDHPQYLKAPFWTVDTLFFLTIKGKNNLKFLYSLFQVINWKKYDESTGLPSLSKKTINNILIKVPQRTEQKKIGNIISQIDSLLSLQQRKHKCMQQIYSYYLNTLINFSNTSELIPLKKLVIFPKKTINPQNHLQDVFYELSMPAYDNNRIPQKQLGRDMHSMRLLIEEPVILFNKLNVRKKRIWNINSVDQKYVSSMEFIPIKPVTNKIDQLYLYFILNTDYVTTRMQDLSTGSSNSQKRINLSDIELLEVPVPKIEYQIKVANILSNLKQEEKRVLKIIEQLKLFKRFLLQNMFI